MLGELYERALAGLERPGIERADGRTTVLPVQRWPRAGVGPWRLTVALGERMPGTGRWDTVLLADGNVGINCDPAALQRRAKSLLKPYSRVVTEIGPPGTPLRRELGRLRMRQGAGARFPWAWVGTDHIRALADTAGLRVAEIWAGIGRWLAALSPQSAGHG